ncbi:hypothetical protein [Propionivibrio sp.]|uniref:hypothetical protein n=1 Tax=Propionivibrio sp. TaxID=2212460 RepID=UPI003BF08161
MINLRAVARIGIGFGRRQMAAIGLAISEAIAKPVGRDLARLGGGGEPRVMELHRLHILKRRQRAEDEIMLMLLS